MKIKNRFKLFCAAILITLIIFLLSPWISLLLPGKLKDHVYAIITYRVIADEETQDDTISKEQQLINLFNYVRMNILGQRNAVPYKGKPLDYLINGIGWCDYMSKTLNCLLAQKDIPSRYAMLLDKEGNVSVHTLNEIFIGGKWVVFDCLVGVIFKDKDGQYLTLQEISDKPYVRFSNPRLIVLSRFSGNSYDYYSNMFPILHPPRRSESGIDDLNVFDRLTIMFANLFKENFSNLFQDIYLKIKSYNFKDDYRLYYLARNYHLHYRFDLAKEHYLKLINDYPNSQYSEDSLLFLGLLYINVNHNYKEAITILQSMLSKYPNTKWIDSLYLYLGLAYEKIGNSKEADINYLNADKFKLDTDIVSRILKYKS